MSVINSSSPTMKDSTKISSPVKSMWWLRTRSLAKNLLPILCIKTTFKRLKCSNPSHFHSLCQARANQTWIMPCSQGLWIQARTCLRSNNPQVQGPETMHTLKLNRQAVRPTDSRSNNSNPRLEWAWQQRIKLLVHITNSINCLVSHSRECSLLAHQFAPVVRFLRLTTWVY